MLYGTRANHTEESIKNVYVAYFFLPHYCEWKNSREMFYKHCETIEFIHKTGENYIIRRYYKKEKIMHHSVLYKNRERHGIEWWYNRNGTLRAAHFTHGTVI